MVTAHAPRPPAPTARDARLDAARDPIPAAIERGPVARMHWRHGLDVDPALAAATVDTPDAPREWSALLAETHAALLDPRGNAPLARPSPVGRTVGEALQASPSWPTIADAARSHPMVAREAVVGLADVVLSALRKAGATHSTDTRASAAALDAARAALERARAAQKTAREAGDKPGEREALRKVTEAAAQEERARAAVAVDEGIAARAAVAVEAAETAIAAVLARAEERTEAINAFDAALGSGQGVGGHVPLPDDVVAAITPEIAAMLRLVGALRSSLRDGRATRHVKGREGMIGVGQGGLDRAADLTPVALAGLAGHLGAPMAALTRLALVEGNATVTEKGGGIARDGDVVVVLDKSGSMGHAGREVWAGALSLAVILEARADGRTCALVTYDGKVRHALVIDSPATLSRAVLAVAEESGGDNNEHAALIAAGKCLAAMPHGGSPADILMVTDGQWKAGNIDGTGTDRARLRGVFIGGVAPVGAGFASTWEVRATTGAEANALAVTIARTIV